MPKDIREAALRYHREPRPGKLEISATKPLANQADLALAYSPGVAEACNLIVQDPQEAASVTARANLVGVITNGTAVLGLGPIGPLASKPVMEGKAVLFKKFANIDVFDIEVDALDPELFIDVVAALEPTFGGINLEDIKAPECFEIEKKLRERMNIPVFHDDQHGTAIIVAAAIYNGLRMVGKNAGEVKVVTSGAGAAAIACLNLLVAMGVDRKNIWVTDIVGVVHEGREEQMDQWKGAYAQKTDKRTLGEVIEGADVFLGLSAPGVLKQEMVKKMASAPIIMALANPVPEILPEEAKEVRPDAIICSGRSDYPNQVNNVLCFPFIFRGALDVGATTINEEMKLACVEALADLAMAEPSEVVVRAYGETRSFGPEYLIPRPFDPRLLVELAPRVAKAAMDSGVATRPIEDFEVYKQHLSEFVFRSGLVMKPVFDQARKEPKRIIYAEGEDERVLRAVQSAIDEGIAKPILVGRPEVIGNRIERLGLRIDIDAQVEVINPQADKRYKEYWTLYHELLGRKGVTPDVARTIVRTRNTVIACLAVHRKDADALICGVEGRFPNHVQHIREVIGLAGGAVDMAAMSLLILGQGTYFLCDTYVNKEHSVEDLVEMTLMASAAVRRFGIEPKVALVSHANFGSSDSETAAKMRAAVARLHKEHPELEVDGEMHADSAIDESIRLRSLPDSRLQGSAHLIIMPTLDAANISFNLLKVLGNGLPVGPMMLGTRLPAHVLTSSVTARGVLNMTAVACVDAQAQSVEGGG